MYADLLFNFNALEKKQETAIKSHILIGTKSSLFLKHWPAANRLNK